MRYVLTNLFFMGTLLFSIKLVADTNKEPEQNEESTERFEPDWDKTVRDIEKDAEVHNSWNTWGLN